MSGKRVKGKFHDACLLFVCHRLFYRFIRAPYELLDRGTYHHTLVDILTRHASPYVPFLPPRLGHSLSSSSHAWLTPSAFSSMTLPPPSLTFLLPTHSQSQTFSRAGIPASPSPPARPSPVSRETAALFMSHPGMAPRFPFSGRVRPHPTFLYFPPIPIVPTGNGIQLSGLAEGPITYDLQLDGRTNSSISPSTSGRTLLAEYDGLPPGNHNLSLIVHNPTNSTSALIAIDHALITVNSTSPKYDHSLLFSCALRGNSDTDYTQSSTTFSTSVIDDTSLPFTGQWSFQNNSLLSSPDNTYHTTTNAGDFVNFNFSGAFALARVFCLPLTVHPHHYHQAPLCPSLGSVVQLRGDIL
jgi:hypothetical protein